MDKIVSDIMGEKILISENPETGKISNINLTLMFGKDKEKKHLLKYQKKQEYRLQLCEKGSRGVFN